MTLGRLLDWLDVTRPNAYSRAQKTAWVNDLESMLWTQIFLCPMAAWRAYGVETDGGARLLLPDGWRRVYTSYLTAMLDLADGEYTQYQNSMSVYNGCIAELGAWYADEFEPAAEPPRWTELGGASYTELTGETLHPGVLPGQAALLAAECRVEEPFGSEGLFTVAAEDGTVLAEVPVGRADGPRLVRAAGFRPPSERDEALALTYTGPAQSRGRLALRLLLQPRARHESLFS